LKTIDERIKSFETNTSLRESVFLSSSVRSRDGFQPLVPREKGRFFLPSRGPSFGRGREGLSKPSFFFFFLFCFGFGKKKVGDDENKTVSAIFVEKE
jgi:hypothetical protein